MKRRVQYAPGRFRLVDVPDPPRSVLLTGGLGDAFALDSFTSPETRDQIEQLVLACPATVAITQLFQALPNYPVLESFQTVSPRGKTYYCKADVEKDHGPQEAEDWSIATVFPQARPYAGSSFLEHRLCRPRRIGRPYAVVAPHSSWGVWEGRSFDKGDWDGCLDCLGRAGLLGVVLFQGQHEVPDSPLLLPLQNRTPILETVELLKAAEGYIGIDSALSVLAAKLFPVGRLVIKSVWSHCYQWQHVYFAPRTSFGFLIRKVENPLWK